MNGAAGRARRRTPAGPPGRAEAADREGVRRLRRHLRLPAGACRAGPPRRARRPGARPDADAGAGPAALPAAAVAADHHRRRRRRDGPRPAVPWLHRRSAGVKLVGDITYIPTWQGWLFLIVTWNQMAGWTITDRHRPHELRGPVGRDEVGGEVAGPWSARASGGVAGYLDQPGAGAANDRRVCPGAGRVPAGL